MVAAGPLGTPIFAHPPPNGNGANAHGNTTLVSIHPPCTAPHPTAERRYANPPADPLTHDLGCWSQICIMGRPSFSADR